MYEKNFVICDSQKKYADNLLKMFSLNKGGDYQYYLFHTVEELTRFSGEKSIRILLIGEELYKEQKELESAEQVFVLVDGKVSDEMIGEKQIVRYQSVDEIWKYIHRNQNDSKPANKLRKTKRKRKETVIVKNTSEEGGHGEIIAVYSPIHRIGKTKFAIELGKRLSKTASVLYLNLEAYSGGAYYFPDKKKEDLGDLIYYMRQKNEKTGLRISVIAGQNEGLDYIQPMKNMQDLMAVRGEEWISLLETILEECIYEKVIVDLGDEIDGIFSILEKCSCIYTPFIEGGPERAKMAQYTENIRRMGKEEILEKTVQINTGRSIHAAADGAGV